jgi:hypothetical protein
LIPQQLTERIDRLINDLIEDGGVASASVASILVAAQEAVEFGYDVALCRSVWAATAELEFARRHRPAVAAYLAPPCES